MRKFFELEVLGLLLVDSSGTLEVELVVTLGVLSELPGFEAGLDDSPPPLHATKPIAKMVEIIAKSLIFFIMKCSFHYNCDFLMKSYLSSYYNTTTNKTSMKNRGNGQKKNINILSYKSLK